MKLRVLPGAIADLDEAAAWHEERVTGGAHKLLRAIDEAVHRAHRWPERYPLWMHAPAYRRVLVRIYKYAVVYRIEGETVVVVAIAHTSRDVAFWEGRDETP